MNKWKIPAWLETEVLLRDTSCIYCRIDFSISAASRGAKPSWEHIVNDETIINRENISRCCMSCNSSKGAKNLDIWLESTYCKRKGISKLTVAQVVREALQTEINPAQPAIHPESASPLSAPQPQNQLR